MIDDDDDRELTRRAKIYVQRVCDGLDDAVDSADGFGFGVLIAEAFQDLASMFWDARRPADAAAVCTLVECIAFGAGFEALASLSDVVEHATSRLRPTPGLYGDPEMN